MKVHLYCDFPVCGQGLRRGAGDRGQGAGESSNTEAAQDQPSSPARTAPPRGSHQEQADPRNRDRSRCFHFPSPPRTGAGSLPRKKSSPASDAIYFLATPEFYAPNGIFNNTGSQGPMSSPPPPPAAPVSSPPTRPAKLQW